MWLFISAGVNTLRPRQNGRHFADDIFKLIFLNENVWISIEISLKFVPQGPINNIPALFQIMAWRRSGDKPLSGPMMVRLPTHICVTRPQWVKVNSCQYRNFDCVLLLFHTVWFYPYPSGLFLRPWEHLSQGRKRNPSERRWTNGIDKYIKTPLVLRPEYSEKVRSIPCMSTGAFGPLQHH